MNCILRELEALERVFQAYSNQTVSHRRRTVAELSSALNSTLYGLEEIVAGCLGGYTSDLHGNFHHTWGYTCGAVNADGFLPILLSSGCLGFFQP